MIFKIFLNIGSKYAITNNQNISFESGLLILLFFLYLVLSPFYIFTSGYPQPADFILFLAMGSSFVVFLINKDLKANQIYLVGLIFAAHSLLINMIHYVYYPDIRFLLTSAIYIFNIGVFIFTSSLMRKYPKTILNIILYGVVLTVIIQFLHIQFIPTSHAFRAVGTFNNPNQLAYWVLLSASILFLIKSNSKLNLLDYGLLGLLYYIQIVALSKAGIITLALLYFLFFTLEAFKSKYRNIIFLIIPFLIIAGITQLSNISLDFSNYGAIEKAAERIVSIGDEGDDSLEGRGYDRLVENPIFLILGAGEGAFWRHEGGGHNQELHSGVATIFFSYGLMGTLLFSFLIFKVLRPNPIFYTAVFFIVMMYGFTHQNFRFSLFWVFLSIIYMAPTVLNQHEEREKEEY